jgi:opacity protein-like surface antigen
LGHWRRNARPGQNGSITEVGLTPVFRVQRNDLHGPYVEAGIGYHYLTRTRIGGRRLSTRFQFGDHLGVGYRFGARRSWDVSFRYQHLSNADIKRPNSGINFHQIRLQYHF